MQLTKKTIILEFKAPSTVNNRLAKKKIEVFMIYRGKVLLTKQTTNKLDTKN